MEMIQETPQSRLTELSSKAQEQAESAAFMEPGEKVKKSRGRPKGSTSAKKESKKVGEAQGEEPKAARPETQTIPTAQVVRPFVNLLSSAGAAFAEDERARMRPEELEAGAQALGMLVDKYMPNLINAYGVEITCLMVFGQYGLRVYAIKKLGEIERMSQPEAPKQDSGASKVDIPGSIVQ